MAFEGVVSFGLEKLWELLSRESERLSGISEQVDGLKRKLRRLQSLLEDAYAKKHKSKRVRTLLEDVQDIVYDAEDIIESFLLKESRGKEKGINKRIKRFACFLIDRRRFALDIEGITKRISEVIEEMKSFGIQELIDSNRSLSMQDKQRVQREIRKTFPNSHESDLVGVEQSVEELVGRLVENDNSFQVVSITGMGGIGKTTLARQVFHHGSVRSHFDGFAWVCVSQEFTQKHIWQKILQDLKPRNDEDILKMDEHTLQRKLFPLLETSRYMIVLDDVWKNEDWDRIKAVFPPKRGLKILLTSRNESVGFHADSRCFPFRPRILTDEESWNLFQRTVFPRRDETDFRVDEELESLGKKMVTYCAGLPLAVRVLGGLLATKHTVPEWERVRDNIRPHIVGGITYGIVDVNNVNSVNRVLSLSYEDLSMELKRCFLYLAHYPEDDYIDMEDLFSCWAAEGMIVLDGSSTIRGTGEAYMQELVRRNMVIAERNIKTSRIENCQMHDMMREVCLSKAKEENFLHVFKVPTPSSTLNSQSASRSRRLVVDNNIAFETLGDKSNLKVRSIICFAFEKHFWIKSTRRFERLPLLRVLDLSYVCFKGRKSLSSIGELIHLRFLSLYDAEGVSHLPSSLGNLKLLLHLNLEVSSGDDVHVPNVLKNMLELRWLRLPTYMDSKTKLELGELVNLEYLKGFSMELSSVTDLLGMTKLRTLDMCLTGGFCSETLSLSFPELENLEELHLFDFVVPGFVLDLINLIHLKELELASMLDLDQHQFPPHLPHIFLHNCRLVKDPMAILEKLLHLKSVKLSTDAFEGRRMVCSKGGFPQLCILEISGQMELEEWIVEEGSMPCLQTLTINFCKELKEIPCGLKYITSLKELKIQSMKKDWEEKLVPGGEDYYKVQHIPNVQFINCVY